jgi:hypothetical protein
MRILAPLLLLTACGMGPSDETLLDELRVIGAVVEPPEIAPGESVDVTATVVDPLQAGMELIIWACTPTTSGCAEDRLPLAERMAVPAMTGNTGTATLRTPIVPLPEDTVISGIVWLLACEPGLCEVIAEARTALANDSDFPDALRDPVALLQSLPLTGVSLATRLVGLSNRPEGERNANPIITVTAPLPATILAEEELDFPLDILDDTVTDGLVAVGLTTGGGFGSPLFDVFEGRADLVYFAPDQSGVVDLYVIVEDGNGGSAVWTGQTTVE